MFVKFRVLLYVIGFFASLFLVDTIKDRTVAFYKDWQNDRAHTQQLEVVVDRSNREIALKNDIIDSLEKDADAREAEIKWARWRVQEREDQVVELREENDELQKILDSRIPVGLIK